MSLRLLLALLFPLLAYCQDLPAPSTSSGRELFEAFCAACHGADGKGQGPAARALRKKPTDLTTLARRNGGRFPGAEVAKELNSVYQAPHGSAEMPIWGPFLANVSPKSDALGVLRVANIVKYIESLQVK